MGEHAGELVTVEHLQDALGHGHRGVPGAATGGEGVGLHLRRDVDAGRGDVRLGGETLHDLVELGVLLAGGGDGPGGLDGEACR